MAIGAEEQEGMAAGAAAGAAAGPWGALIGAGVGFIGGMMKGRAAKKQAQKKQAALDRMRMLASPEHLKEVMDHLNPLMRNIVASGLGPQFKQNVDQALSQHGLTGTGAGEALRTAGAAAPAMFATQMGAEEAKGVVSREMAAEGANAELTPLSENPLMDALLGAARGYLSGGGIHKKAGSSGAAMSAAPQADISKTIGAGGGAALDPITGLQSVEPK